MYPFEYLAPRSLEEALAMLAQRGDEAKVLAGGQSLLVLMRQGFVAPEYIVDIGRLQDLAHVGNDDAGNLLIGGLATHRSVETSPLVQNGFRVLADMERGLASPQVRNRGTLGGSICHADPAGDAAPVLTALDAVVTLAAAGDRTRRLPVAELNIGFMETVMEPDELLVEITIPKPQPPTGVAYGKFSLVGGDFATASVAVRIGLDAEGGRCREARIVLGAVGTTAKRARQAEEALVGQDLDDDTLANVAELAAGEVESTAAMSGSTAYKRDLVRVLVPRIGREAWSRAQQEQVT